MGFTARDVVPFTQARAKLSDLAEQVKAGAEEIISKSGENDGALIDSDLLAGDQRLERERMHLLSIRRHRRLSFVFAGLWPGPVGGGER